MTFSKAISLIAVLACTMVTPDTAKGQSEIYPQHFELDEVTLTDGHFRTSMVLNAKYLLDYDADRLMCPFVRQAGLSTKSGSKYYGWTQSHPSFSNWGLSDWSLEGHVGGHYITALSLAYAATKNDPSLADLNAKLSVRLNYCLDIMKDCQDAYDSSTNGMKGFIGGQPINQAWTDMYSGNTDTFKKYGGWVPFYCQHKVLAGLRDAYLYGDDKSSAKAKPMFKGLCDWSINVISKLNDSQVQDILGWEHGGMNEPLADAYIIFGEAKYMTGAKRYCHNTMVDNMQKGYSTTFLDGKHANTQVPKYIGFERVGTIKNTALTSTVMSRCNTSAHNFWEDVAERRTVCIGGNSVGEHFLSVGNSGRYISQLDGPESCNSNNMLKLSELLFDETHDSKYADFYEGTMYNHILSTQDPNTGGYVYFTTLRPQGYRIYSQVNKAMWCCVGTGMENHSKYGHFIYTHDDATNTLYVNLYTASKLNADKYALTQKTNFPFEQRTTITVDKAGTYTIAIRKPSWVAEGYAVKVNGTAEKSEAVNGYVSCNRTWKVGDVIEVDLPMSLRYETCPNLNEYVAFKYGPILLGAKTPLAAGETSLRNEYAGEGRMDHAPGSMATSLEITSSPLLICDRSELLNRIKVKDIDRLQFTLDATSEHTKWGELTLEPFYAIHHSRYMCYWYQQSEEAYQNSELALEEKMKAQFEARTVDFVGTGEQQSEAGHAASYSTGSTSGSYNGEFYRDAQANGYIQYTLTIPDSIRTRLSEGSLKGLSLICRFTTADRNRKATITIDGTTIADVTIPASRPGTDSKGFYNDEYSLDESLWKDKNGNVKKSLTFRIKASSTTLCPGLYYLRLMKEYSTPLTITNYEYKAEDWAHTGDAGRVAQSRISYDATANTVKVIAGTGSNNVCLNFSTSKYIIDTTDHYFYIVAQGIKTTTGSSYLWWFDGVNHGTSVAPTNVEKSGDDVILTWDIATSGLNDNGGGTYYKFSEGNTIFGLTATTGTAIIKHIGFSSDIPTSIKDFVFDNSNTARVAIYDTTGRKVSRADIKDTSVYITNGKKYTGTSLKK